MTSCLFENLTLATFLKAEFGFLGVMVLTDSTTPLLNGEAISENFLSLELNQRRREAVLLFLVIDLRPWRTNCDVVGIIYTTTSGN